MKTHVKILFALCVLLCTAGMDAQTRVLLTKYDGSEQAFMVSDNGQLTFDATHVLIDEDGANTTTAILRSEIRKITFATLTGLETTEPSAPLLVYPNPASDFIRIATDDETFSVRIFSPQGVCVLSQICKKGDAIAVSTLPKGFYLLRVNNSIIKFVKQ
ncbi:MAG: T9SS type A sorting domain-containing protein [Candidatus Symbiothrix sp.]|jgi:hypothetical protein|nr:T9SS type A sorting domain-containing protein [Candidatus Symbiothrix sp.]